MPTLHLVDPVSVEQSKAQARTGVDEYGFGARFRASSVDELVAAFNSSVGSIAWVRARGVYLIALRDALLATDLDCSSFISDRGMNMDQLVEQNGHAIMRVDTGP